MTPRSHMTPDPDDQSRTGTCHKAAKYWLVSDPQREPGWEAGPTGQDEEAPIRSFGLAVRTGKRRQISLVVPGKTHKMTEVCRETAPQDVRTPVPGARAYITCHGRERCVDRDGGLGTRDGENSPITQIGPMGPDVTVPFPEGALGAEGALLPALKMKETGHKPRQLGDLGKRRKARKWILPRSLQKGTRLCRHLDFNPLGLVLDSDLNCKIIDSCWVKPPRHSSNGRLIPRCSRGVLGGQHRRRSFDPSLGGRRAQNNCFSGP